MARIAHCDDQRRGCIRSCVPGIGPEHARPDAICNPQHLPKQSPFDDFRTVLTEDVPDVHVISREMSVRSR